ncbi:MAG: TAP42-like protein [Piptocephalis tieghemiana]|nr:MAG: TAP42-like protein [Piptocephalis tieghemiana]
MSNQSLSQVYVDTQEAFEAWCASPHPTISKEHQALWSQARQRLIRLSDMVDRAALFSDNESLRDLSTSTVKFLLVPAWLGKVLMDQVGEGRKQGLLLGRAQHMRFLALCHQYNLLQDQDRHRQEAIESVAKDALQGIPHRPGQGPDAATRRALKIAQYSKEKTTKAAIQKLEKRSRALLESEQEDNEEEKEEVERNLILSLVELQIQQSLGALESINEELPMILDMEKRKQEHPSSSSSSSDSTGWTDRLEGPGGRQGPTQWSGPLLTPNGQPARPFIITSQRQEVRDGVFRPSWRLPTMTIDEYLEEEQRRGNIISGGGPESAKSEEKDENDVDDATADAATLKAREWDEYKDANPTGWGNRIGRG